MRTKRDVPLEVCPNLDCVRSGQCRARRPEQECRKFHMTVDERRIQIAEQLEAIHAEFLADNPGHVPRQMSEEDLRYELRKAVCEAAIALGNSGAAAHLPPAKSFTSEEMRRFREGKSPNWNAETPLLDRPEGTS
jgi:hypothetical protein